MFATIFAILILVLAGWAIAKNYDAKVVLFAAGFLLMYAALIMGSDVLTGKDASGLAWADPFKAVKDLFIKQYANAGLIILTLFGFAAYMSKIGANDKVIELLSRPLAAVKSPYILVPLVFWLGTLLSIIIPSAASLAVILMATLYPVLKAAKMLCHDFQYRRQSLFCVGLRHGHWGRGLCHRSRQCACRGDSFLARMPHDGTAQT